MSEAKAKALVAYRGGTGVVLETQGMRCVVGYGVARVADLGPGEPPHGLSVWNGKVSGKKVEGYYRRLKKPEWTALAHSRGIFNICRTILRIEAGGTVEWLRCDGHAIAKTGFCKDHRAAAVGERSRDPIEMSQVPSGSLIPADDLVSAINPPSWDAQKPCPT